jgi:hypothetical protein
VLHLDTDLSGDPDDVCALAMLLGSRGVELASLSRRRSTLAAGAPVRCC